LPHGCILLSGDLGSCTLGAAFVVVVKGAVHGVGSAFSVLRFDPYALHSFFRDPYVLYSSAPLQLSSIVPAIDLDLRSQLHRPNWHSSIRRPPWLGCMHLVSGSCACEMMWFRLVVWWMWVGRFETTVSSFDGSVSISLRSFRFGYRIFHLPCVARDDSRTSGKTEVRKSRECVINFELS
jgi:hypothetical protein